MWKYQSFLYDKDEKEVYTCFLSNEQYIPGVLALAYSLDSVNSQKPLYIIVPEKQEEYFELILRKWNLRVISLPELEIDNELLEKSVVNSKVDYWKNTFFKLQVSKLQQFRKIVLLDADMIVLRNIDHVFDFPHMSAVAAGRILHEDWIELNSGFIVIEPNKNFDDMIHRALPIALKELIGATKSFGDQDIFNFCYKEWPYNKELHLPETYNAMTDCINVIASKYGLKNIYIAHFIGKIKPWNRNKRYLYCLFKEAVKQWKFSEFFIFLKYWLILKKLV